MVRQNLYRCNYAFAKAIILITASTLISCNSKDYHLTTISAKQVKVDSTINANSKIEEFITPYRDRVDEQMDEALTYSSAAMHKNDFKLNTPISNLFAEAVKAQAEPIYKSRTDDTIDVVLLNHGGIRASLPKGRITMRNAYEIMPFENTVIVARLNYDQMYAMIEYLVEKKRAHPLYGLKIVLNEDGSLKSATINDQPLSTGRIYHVATNDYLYNGGDDMSFFNKAAMTDIDYKLRNVLIDYFKKMDTLKFSRDDRFSFYTVQ